LAESVTIRWFAAYAAGDPAAVCGVYQLGRTAQLDGLFTFARYRRRRHGYAVLAAAIKAAAADSDLVFGVADAGGWPEAWFGRMGFEAVAERAEALRVVGATATRV
jgi:hypothetical protein